MNYLAQMRNLANEAEIQRDLLNIKLAESRILKQKVKKQYEKKNSLSRQQQDKQTAIFLKRSRLQAQLDASNVSANAILTRSRVESALQLRQANQTFINQREIALREQAKLREKQFLLQRQLQQENKRQLELLQLKRQNFEEQLLRKKIIEEKEYERQVRNYQREIEQRKRRLYQNY